MDMQVVEAPATQVDQAAQTETAAPAVAAVEPVATVPQDRDEAELQAAMAAIEKAKAPAEEVKPVEATPAAPAPATTEGTLKLEPVKNDQTAAIIAIRKALQQSRTNELLLAGQVQALTALVQDRPANEDRQVDKAVAVDPLQQVRSQKIALADKFDAGEITAKDMEAQRQALDDQEWEIRRTGFQPVVQAAPQSDLQLEQATVALETQYPVLSILTAEDLAPLADIAKRQAEREGKPIESNALGTLNLRTRIAALAQQMYGGGTATTTTVSTSAAPQLSPTAQAREAKLDMQSRMPPDISTMGSAGTSGAMSEAEILGRMANMSEDEQFALMKSLPGLSARILGG